MAFEVRLETRQFVSHPWGTPIEGVYAVTLIATLANQETLLALCQRLLETYPHWIPGWEAAQSETNQFYVSEADNQACVCFVVDQESYETFKAELGQTAAALRAEGA